MYLPRLGDPGPGRKILAPHELNAEIGGLVGEVNGGLDRENIPPSTVTAAKVATGEMHKLWRDPQIVVDRVSAISKTLYPGALQPIPDDAGNDWVSLFDVEEDGDLSVTLGGSVRTDTAGFDAGVHLAVDIDGIIVARLDSASRLRQICFELSGRLPVTAGRHQVRYMWGFRARVEFTAGTEIQLLWQQTTGIVRWLGR